MRGLPLHDLDAPANSTWHHQTDHFRVTRGLQKGVHRYYPRVQFNGIGSVLTSITILKNVGASKLTDERCHNIGVTAVFHLTNVERLPVVGHNIWVNLPFSLHQCRTIYQQQVRRKKLSLNKLVHLVKWNMCLRGHFAQLHWSTVEQLDNCSKQYSPLSA